VNGAALVNELAEAADERTGSRVVARYGRLDLLCLDELGYLHLDPRGAELLFQVLTERDERASIAAASNAPFSEWGQTFTDPRLAAAIVDRLTFRAHILETGAASYRLRVSRGQSGSAAGKLLVPTTPPLLRKAGVASVPMSTAVEAVLTSRTPRYWHPAPAPEPGMEPGMEPTRQKASLLAAAARGNGQYPLGALIGAAGRRAAVGTRGDTRRGPRSIRRRCRCEYVGRQGSRPARSN